MSVEELKDEVTTLCQFILCSQADVFAVAPGVVEVLGNHGDYNESLMITAPIDRYTVIAGRRTTGHAVSVYSDAYERLLQFNTEKMERDGTAPWLDYVMGVVDRIQQSGRPLGAFEAAICADIPLGAGMGSSVSLTMAMTQFLNKIFELDLPANDSAHLCREAEVAYVEKPCAIQGPTTALCGSAGHLLYMDCRDCSTQAIAFPEELALVMADTKVSHDLADETWRSQEAMCREAASRLAEKLDGVTHLRDVTVEQFEPLADTLPEEMVGVARHVISENERVLDGKAALEAGDAVALGRLMQDSHASSRDQFGNSCAELDQMVSLACELDGCYGARLSGAGFGGSTVNLVARDALDHFCAELSQRYETATGQAPELQRLQPARGAWTEGA